MKKEEQECVDLVKALSVERALKIVNAMKNTTAENELAFKALLTMGLRFSKPRTLDNRTLTLRRRRNERRQRKIKLSVGKPYLVAA